jgi:hypothetical protein
MRAFLSAAPVSPARINPIKKGGYPHIFFSDQINLPAALELEGFFLRLALEAREHMKYTIRRNILYSPCPSKRTAGRQEKK